MKKLLSSVLICATICASSVLAGCQAVGSSDSLSTAPSDISSDIMSGSSSGIPSTPPASEEQSSSDSDGSSSTSSQVSSTPASSSQPQSSSKPTLTFTLNRKDITFISKGARWYVYDGTVPLEEITWHSQNPAVATFESGKVTAVGNGTTTIYAEHNGRRISCIIHCKIPAASSSKPIASSKPVSSNPSSFAPAYTAGTYKTTANLNCRTGAGTSYTKLLTIPKGTALIITKFVNGWGYVTYNGVSGYVSMDYVKKVSDSTDVPVSSKPSSSNSSSNASSGNSPSAPSSSAPSSSAPVDPVLTALRKTNIYKAVKKLNSLADFTNPDAYGETAYDKSWFSANGFEKTASGLPDYSKIKELGICCAGFVNYYLFNYLPNVAGVNTGITWVSHPNNEGSGLQASRIRASTVSYTMNQSNWTKTYGTELVVDKDYSFIADDYAAGKLKYKVGDIITMSWTKNPYHHVAVYAGYYNGQHWLAHSTDTPTGVGVTLTPFNGYCLPRKEYTVYVTEIFTP